MYRFWRIRLTLWAPAKTSSTSSGVNSRLSIWKMLSSSHSKPETTTNTSYQVVYTKRYNARRATAPEAKLGAAGAGLEIHAFLGLKMGENAEQVLGRGVTVGAEHAPEAGGRGGSG